MCEFCKEFDDFHLENKKLLDKTVYSEISGSVAASICLYKGFLMLTVGNYDNAVKINYCPMCGKELKA